MLSSLLAALLLAGAGCLSGTSQSSGQVTTPAAAMSGPTGQPDAGTAESSGGMADGGSMMGDASPMMGGDSMMMGRQYTMAEVAQHDSASDCWVTVSGSVYDVTGYIPKHPGGDKILQGCGKDITAFFTTAHSKKGLAVIPQFKIGELSQ